jgi:16S rRNA (cytidine1402-2'-O)-methyltransferase
VADPGGVLTLVGTPIGNLGDVTPAALAALQDADVICAEDTRRTRKLLTAHGIRPRRLTSIRAQNEEREAARVVRWVAEGRAVTYVTDAGMPAVSDPGERLVRAVLAAGGRVAAAPGPDAATTALTLSGLPAQRWAFEGFLPLKGQAREERLAHIAAEPRTSVVYEAPHRLARTLADLAAHVGPDRPVAVANDLTKRHERVWRGPLGQVAADLAATEPRGEFVVVIGPAGSGGPGATAGPRRSPGAT